MQLACEAHARLAEVGRACSEKAAKLAFPSNIAATRKRVREYF